MDKRAKDKLVRSPGENEGGQDAQKYLHSKTRGDEKKGKTQEKLERGSRKRSSSAGSEKIEKCGGRQEKMEEHCSTGQSPQWAVVPMEEEVGDIVFDTGKAFTTFLHIKKEHKWWFGICIL